MDNLETIFDREAMARGAAGLQSALANPMSPDEAAKFLKLSRKYGVPPTTAQAITPQQEAASQVNEVKKEYLPSPYWEKVGDPALANFVKDDVTNVGRMAGIAYGMFGTGSKPEDNIDAMQNSAARGVYGLFNTLPIFGNTARLREVQSQIDRIRQTEAELAAGKSDAEVFGTPEDPTGAIGRLAWDKSAAQDRETLVAERGKLLDAEAWAARQGAAFPMSEAMEEFSNTDGLLESAGWAARNFGTFISNVLPESFVQYAPAVPAIAAGGVVGGLPLAAAIQGSYSYGLDRSNSLLGQMADKGVDLTNPQAIAEFMDSPDYAQALKKADAHGMGVAAFDALSLRLAAIKIPNSLPKAVAELSPTAERWYSKTMSAPYIGHFARTAIQGVIQGAAGGAGEATGQLLADNEVTSWADVVAEFAGEFGTSPIEVATASISTTRDLYQIRQKTQAFQAKMAEINQRAKQSPSIPRDPQTIEGIINDVAQAGQDRGNRDAFTEVAFSAEALRQEGIYDDLIRISPAARAQMEQALATGGDIVIPIGDYVAHIAPTNLAEVLLPYAHPTGEVTEAEATELAQAAINETTDKVAAASNASPEFKTSLAEVGESIVEDLKASGVSVTEVRGLTSILTTLVGSMATDAGVTPKAVWNKYGARFLGAEDTRLEGDQVVALTERAKQALESGKTNTLDPDQTNVKKSYAQETLGAYFPDKRVVARWANANQSTFLHETGHLFLDMRVGLALDIKNADVELTAGQQRLVNDTEEAIKRFGGKSLEEFAAMSTDAKRSIHEKFARTFEQYLYEGRAPTAGLARVFRRFKAWLMKVYAPLASVPGAEMSDDVRALFDRLFVSAEAERQARARRGLYMAIDRYHALPSDESRAAMDAAWDELYAEAQAEAQERLTAAGMRDIAYARKLHGSTVVKLTKLAQQYRQRFYELAKEQLLEQKVYQAEDKIRNGVGTKKGLVRVKPTVKELAEAGVPQEQIDLLLERGLAYKRRTPDSIPADELAKALGYASVGELASELTSVPTLEDAAQAEAERQMLERYGELTTEEGITELADAAIFNPSAARLVAHEINYLESATSDRRVSVPFFRELAQAELRSVPVKKMLQRAKQARSSVTRLHDQALKLINKDPKQAAQVKRKELYQMVFAEEAQRAYERLMRDEAKLRKRYVGKKEYKSIRTPYLVQIQGFMDRFAVTQKRALEPAEPYDKFVQSATETDGMAPPELPLELASLPVLDSDRTYGQARAAADFIDDLATAGRMAQTVVIEGKRVEIETIQGEVSDAMLEHFQSRGAKVKLERESDGSFKKFRDALAKVGFAHARIPSLLFSMEGTRTGKVFEYIIKRFDRCATWAEDTQAKMSEKLWEASKPLHDLLKDHKHRYFEGLGKFAPSELVVMALNLGNQENLDRLLSGFDQYESADHNIDPEARREALMAAISETLTADQINALQAVWDVQSEFWPQIVEQEKRLGHRAPVAVQPQEVVFLSADGQSVTLKGGYYPIVYDRDLSERSDRLEDKALDKQGFFSTQSPYEGFLKSRASRADGRPVALSVRGMFEGLGNVVHDLAWREALIDAHKIFSERGAVAQTIRTYAGADAMRAVRQWLSDIATNGRQSSSAFDGLANILRSGVSMAGLGLNIVTALIQPIGLLQSTAVIGRKWVLVGLGEYLKNPAAAGRFVQSRSSMMQNRIRNRFRELTEVQAEISGNISRTKATVMQWAYRPLVALQGLADLPTWLGAYHQALSDGRTESEAIAIADRMVNEAQGSGRLMDLSGYERGGAWQKLFTVFYSYFNTLLNVMNYSLNAKSRLQFAADALVLMCLQPVIETFLREGLAAAASDKDDDDWLAKTARLSAANAAAMPLGLFVGAREVQSAFAAVIAGERALAYSGPSGTRKLSELNRLATQIGQGEFDQALVKSMVNNLGLWTGLPASQINRTWTGGYALIEDKTDNPLVLFMGYNDKY